MRRSRSKCTHEGCIIAARAGGVCQRHGAKAKKCSHTGCTNGAQAGGVCYRHGAKQKKCTHEGCTFFSRRGGVCCRHGAKSKKCSHGGCSNISIKGGVCVRHGAKVCRRHGAKPSNYCTYEGCSNITRYSGGVGLRHSAKANTNFFSSSEYNIVQDTLADRQNNNIQASIVIIVGTTRMKRNFYERNHNNALAPSTFSKRKKCFTKDNYLTSI
mmetsp:Transcript_18018/g.25666  ORF Transcript_18018/g.25666 Transcript_18018/m.25666 type:complete len:213 (-) Transcript_18018:202-840(-)